MKRAFYLVFGLLCLGLGTVGVVLPILPTVPFYLATVFFFARSSPRLHDWFVSTTLYQKHLASYVQKRGMTRRTKAGLLLGVTLLMGTGFVLMQRVPTARVVLALVWLGHLVYFGFVVKTLPEE